MDEAPSWEIHRVLERAIDDFNARTVPGRDHRFAILLRDAEGALVGGLGGVIGWEWLFVDNLWVHDALQRQGYGRDCHGRHYRCQPDNGEPALPRRRPHLDDAGKSSPVVPSVPGVYAFWKTASSHGGRARGRVARALRR